MKLMPSVSTLLFALAAIMAAPVWGSQAAHAEETVRIAALRGLPLISQIYAERSGAFEHEGIKTSLIILNNGPAVIAAVVSGSADIGFAAAVPMITARAEKQPIKAFVAMDNERYPKPIWNFLIASGRSGAKTVQDLSGKTVASNAATSACDLQIRDQTAHAGIPADALHMVAIPFPQMQAALELGTVDAVCAIDPFKTAIMQSSAIKATILANGMLANLKEVGSLLNDGYFSSDDWLAKHGNTASGFVRALVAANKVLAKDPALYHKLIVDEFKMPAPMADQIEDQVNTGSMAVKNKDIQPLIDALVRTKLLAAPIPASEVVYTVAP